MKTPLQFVTFGLIGVLNSLIQYVVFVVLLRALGVPMLAASAVGYGCGLVNSYALNRRWTFRVARGRNRTEFARFCLVNLAALGINLLVLDLLVTARSLRPEVAQVAAIAASLVVNFAGNKWWTFRGRSG